MKACRDTCKMYEVYSHFRTFEAHKMYRGKGKSYLLFYKMKLTRMYFQCLLFF